MKAEQLGEDKREIAVTTDIAGKKESFAIRLDEEAAIKLFPGAVIRLAGRAAGNCVFSLRVLCIVSV